MQAEVIILIVSFVTLLMLNAPVAFCIAIASFLTALSLGGMDAGYIVAQRMAMGIGSFPLLAIPFFILSGILMGEGGMARRLIDFADAAVGWCTGGLSYANTLTCMLFGSISGSATAAVSSIGGFMIPEMNKQGYEKTFNVAVTTAAATTGLLIPPSNVMIVYAVVAGNVSVAAMFMAGVLPGIVVGLAIMAVCFVISHKKHYGSGQKTSPARIFSTGAKAIPSLLLIVIILGGILSGAFSATEASAVAVVYALILGTVFYREVKLNSLPRIFLQAAKTTAMVMFLIAASQAMSWVLAYQRIPQTVTAGLLSLTSNKIVLFIIINSALLAVGTFMDMTPAVLIFTPILLPVVTALGMHPLHFGIMLIANLCIGLCTPPVGTCLFVGCGVGKTGISEMIKPMLPFYAAMVASLLLITYIPQLSLWLPKILDLT
jgi:tripartite ATP-independent transporter DctM subunit